MRQNTFEIYIKLKKSMSITPDLTNTMTRLNKLYKLWMQQNVVFSGAL